MLVTGAFGLVGPAVVHLLASEGHRVVATDIDTPGNRKKARRIARSSAAEVRWADLTDEGAVIRLVHSAQPSAIVHLAAVIPPLCYARRGLARQVNVGATSSLVRAGGALPSPPRFVLASSVAVFGARNPRRCPGLLTATTPVDPVELYGALKVEAERSVTSSSLEWVILRLGGVLTPAPRWGAGADLLDFEGCLPVDGRLQTIDVRDVACAFTRAVTTDAVNEVFLVGGDDSHRILQGELSTAIAGAMGLAGALPPGRRGDPESVRDWFPTDWMDCERSQKVLSFQRHSLPAVLAETRAAVGALRWPLAVVAPISRAYLRSRSTYRRRSGTYADPWGSIRRRWGEPLPDVPSVT
ncbi:MAG TPA: NAD-dependent epimerase/dehydratase family protein [Acidimicrobiales bacterium]|nr:NAD-dependent epimerase/dehydratase family protein [Acidimicrobiales bacterium]